MSKLDFVESISEIDETNEFGDDPEEICDSVGDPGGAISMPENWKCCCDMSLSINPFEWPMDIGGSW